MTSLEKSLYHQFETVMEDLGGRSFLVEREAATSKLESLLLNAARKIIVYQTPLVERFVPETFAEGLHNLSVEWLPIIRPADFNEGVYRQHLIEADAGLVAANYLIADSGTIVLFGESHRAQLVSLLPPKLLVLATVQQLIPDLFAFHKVIEKDATHHFESIHYITGPSRTSDIEKTLILGVHGPVELNVIVVND